MNTLKNEVKFSILIASVFNNIKSKEMLFKLLFFLMSINTVFSTEYDFLAEESSPGLGFGLDHSSKESILFEEKTFTILEDENYVNTIKVSCNKYEQERWEFDKRVFIQNRLLRKYPYRSHISLKVYFGDDIISVGSAGMISSCFAITAAHNIYKSHLKRGAEKIIAYLCLENEKKCYSSILIKIVALHVNFKSDSLHDYALLYVGEKIGNKLGWMSPRYIPEGETKIFISGYPLRVKDPNQEKKSIRKNGWYLYQHSKTKKKIELHDDSESAESNKFRFFHKIHTSYGQSGSPLRFCEEIINGKELWYTCAIHIQGDVKKGLNFSVPINEETIRLLNIFALEIQKERDKIKEDRLKILWIEPLGKSEA